MRAGTLLRRAGQARRIGLPRRLWGETVPDLYLRTLQRAAKIVGGEQALALHLKVTPSHLTLWLKGLERPTTEAFLRAVDLVSEYELAQLPQAPSITPSAPAAPD